MLLAVDIGNTTICLAILKGQRVVQKWYVDTVRDRRILEGKLREVMKPIKGRSPEAAVICSVVPRALQVVKPILQRGLKIKATVVGEDIKVPITHRYRDPRQVGQDRLVCAYAAKVFYGLPVIVIDLGTAITLDVVSKKAEYLGGIIVPGIRLSAESLFKKTAMLPKIKIKGPQAIIGRNTEESILSGLFFGYGALCRGLIELIAQQIKGKPRVVVTGGYALLMRKYISGNIRAVDKDLVLKGIGLVWKQRK